MLPNMSIQTMVGSRPDINFCSYSQVICMLTLQSRPAPAVSYPINVRLFASFIRFGFPDGIITPVSEKTSSLVRNCRWNISVTPGSGSAPPAPSSTPPALENLDDISPPIESSMSLNDASASSHFSPNVKEMKSSDSGLQLMRVAKGPTSFLFFFLTMLSVVAKAYRRAIIRRLFG